MKVYIENLKRSNHTICRITGSTISIDPLDFVIIDTENETEYQYWSNLSPQIASRCGLKIITDEDAIEQMELRIKSESDVATITSKRDYSDVSIIGDSVSPIAKQIVEDANLSPKAEENMEQSSESSYTEENLLKLSKEDLFNVCDKLDIKYRRNSSVKTLVSLILGSDKI